MDFMEPVTQILPGYLSKRRPGLSRKNYEPHRKKFDPILVTAKGYICEIPISLSIIWTINVLRVINSLLIKIDV